ncbi:unnamed protein product [Clavelina lepadiformis]|uniref:Uncharacterized protein n=1 Tax=Clavelina lepadiformis TaxID=159417 RepID=A0ABP0G8S4_CLALP
MHDRRLLLFTIPVHRCYFYVLTCPKHVKSMGGNPGGDGGDMSQCPAQYIALTSRVVGRWFRDRESSLIESDLLTD